MDQCPKYLLPYEALWRENPRQAKLEWFRHANYGLFMHYGLYSLLHAHEWVMRDQKIPVREYEKLAGQFTAHNFDADKITDLAIESGMTYITITACHHEGFCLWDSQIESFNSVNSPCGRDLIAELSEACDRKGLGFFVYYTFMMNWRHPYFVDQDTFSYGYPHDPETEPWYLYRKKEDFRHYIDYIQQVMDELLSKYKVTGLWLDLIAAWYALGEEYIPIEEIYHNIRSKHPDVLISWKQGATGTEDFASPENTYHSLTEAMRTQFGEAAAQRAIKAFEGNRSKHNEVNSTVQRGTWGYNPRYENRSPDELYSLLGHAIGSNCNLLLNVGVMAYGSISPVHADILRVIGRRIRQEGYPSSGSATLEASAAPAE